MLKRKIENTLSQWKTTPGHKPLVIMRIRQCGKTFIAQHFAAALVFKVYMADIGLLIEMLGNQRK